MGTRHLYWILTGTLFEVYKKTMSTFFLFPQIVYCDVKKRVLTNEQVEEICIRSVISCLVCVEDRKISHSSFETITFE
jgi:hypothetical protein